jgi:hypothetical protein
MAGLDTVKSTSITNLDTVPIIKPTAGAGGLAVEIEVDDYCTATAAGLQSAGSWYKLVRIPTWALVKSVLLGADAGPNLSGSALAIDLSLVFSDSADDGTPTWLQGLIPTSANTGGTTTIASYSSPNLIFGTWKPAASAAIIEPTQLVLNGLGSHYSFTGGQMNLPLYQIFGFTDGRGNAADPGGYFDLMAYVATGATTGGACNIYARVGISDKG